MTRWVMRLYQSRLIERIFHTPVYFLRKELNDCQSVLDLGCGPDSPLQFCKVRYSFGVDIFAYFIEESKRKKIHNEYKLADIADLNFEPRSFDAVVLIEVLEHLTDEQGERLLERIESWARKKIVITTPNGFLPQGTLSQNPYELHRSGWNVGEMTSRGYKAYGISGCKLLRKENTSVGYGAKGEAIFSTLKFRPRFFWLIVSGLSQIITYYFPKLAYEVCYVKKIKGV